MTVSAALAAAFSSDDPPPGFAAVRDALLNSTIPVDPRLFSAPGFPPDVLARVAYQQALGQFSITPYYGDQASMDILPQIQPELDDTDSAVKPWLTVLAGNPAAARMAVDALAGDSTLGGAGSYLFSGSAYWGPFRQPEPGPRPDIGQAIDQLNMLAAALGDPAFTADLGKVYAAAAGADDETDGQHSPEAMAFALALITNPPQWASDEVNLNPGVPDGMQPYLAQVAGAYAREFTASAYERGIGNEPASSLQPLPTDVPGLSGQFTISPHDAYSFIETFADTDADMAPFNQAMGALSEQLLADGARIEKDRGDNPDELGMPEIMYALGDAAGLELAAETTVRGQLDAEDARQQAYDQQVIGIVSTVAGIIAVPGGLVGTALWASFLYGGSTAADAALSDGPTRLSQLSEQDWLAVLGAPDQVARAMLGAGYTEGYTTPLSNFPELTDGHGNLLPITEIVQSPARLDAYYQWLRANGLGGNDRQSFGWLVADASSEWTGQRQAASGWPQEHGW